MTFDPRAFSHLRRAIYISLSLYLIATWCSMAGMEIFGWLTFALTVSYGFMQPPDSPGSMKDLVRTYLPWRAMIGLYLVTIIGIFINGTPAADKLFIIGSQRWMILVCTHAYALFLAPPRFKFYRVFLIFIGIVGAYAIFQSFTGIDFLRINEIDPNRAVHPLDVRMEIRLWRSAGLFGSPMSYVYIAGLHACIPLAVAMIFPRSLNRIRFISLIVFLIVAMSLVTTYVRGAWFAMAVTYLVMAWFASRQVFYWVIGLGSGAFAALFIGLIQFRERLMSVFNMATASNGDRLNLWKMNWRMFLDYPILGIGWEENETRACEYVNCLAKKKPFTGHAHNNYLQALAGMGITGFVFYMTVIGFFLWLTYRLWKRLPEDLYWARALTLGCLGAQIHLHIGGFTECNFKAGATNHNLMVIYGLVASMSFLEAKGLLRKAYPPPGETPVG